MSTLVDSPCKYDPELFFSGYKRDIEEAKAICKTRCNRLAECLTECLEFERMSGETLHGVHGGTTPEERTQLHAQEEMLT